MTIRKGEPWGEPGPLGVDAPVFDSDAEAAAWLESMAVLGDVGVTGAGASAGEGLAGAELGLVAGDLHRTLGSPRRGESDLRAGHGMRFPVDLGVVEFEAADGRRGRSVFLAHLVATTDARGRWWRGDTVLVMNAAFIGDANLGPRAHPNDGRFDVTEGELTWGDRRRAAARAASGSHVPHPALAERRVRELTVRPPAVLHLRADGRVLGPVRSFDVRCLADALTIVV